MSSLAAPTCDQCRQRKIRCGGGDPCFRCHKAQIDCTKDYVHRRRGPKSGTGRVLRQIRLEQNVGLMSESPSPDLNNVDLDPAAKSHIATAQTQRYTDSRSGLQTHADPVQHDTLSTDPRPSPSASSSINAGYDASVAARESTSPSYSPKADFWKISSSARRLPPLIPRPDSISNLLPSIEHTSVSSGWQTSSTPAFRAVSSPASSAFSPLSFGETPQIPLSPRSHPVTSNVQFAKPVLAGSVTGRTSLQEPGISNLAAKTDLPALLLSQCLIQYFRHLHASYPVLQESDILAALRDYPVNRERQCLILSICALTMLRAPPKLFIKALTPVCISRKMVSACLVARSEFDWIEEATLMSVITSYFLCMTYYDLEQKRSYEHHLGQAIQLVHADDLAIGSVGGIEDAHAGKVLHQRVSILLWITNRSDGVQRHKAVSRISRTSIPSLMLDAGDEPKLKGLQLLTSLFDLVGDDFMDTWLSSSCESATHDEQTSILLAKKRTVDQFPLDVSNVTETQLPDLLVSLRWLRLAYWQLLLKKGLVSSATTDHRLSYRYPLDIAQDLCDILQNLPLDVVFRHGRCILEKIFDITYASIDCLAIAGIPHKDSPTLTYLYDYLLCAPEMHSGFAEVLRKHVDGYATPNEHNVPV